MRRQRNRRAYHSAWNPLRLGGVQLWLRSDLGVTHTTTVTAWVDQSGNGNNFVVAGLVAPGYTASQYNGHPGINGVDQTRGLQNLTMPGPGAASTYVYVLSKSTGSSYMAGYNGAEVDIIQNFSGSSLEWFHDSGAAPNRQTLASSLTAGLHQVIVTQVDGVSLVGYVDGVQSFSVTPTYPCNIYPIRYLFGVGTGSSGTTGDIVEVMMLSRAVSSSDVANLHTYSKGFWGTP